MIAKLIVLRYEKDPELKENRLTEFLTLVDFLLSVYDKKLQNNSSQKCMVGDKYTIADFGMFRIGFGFLLNPSNEYNGKL